MSPILNFSTDLEFAILQVSMRKLAMVADVVELSMVRSQFLAGPRHRPIQVKVRSETDLRDKSSKPLAVSNTRAHPGGNKGCCCLRGAAWKCQRQSFAQIS